MATLTPPTIRSPGIPGSGDPRYSWVPGKKKDAAAAPPQTRSAARYGPRQAAAAPSEADALNEAEAKRVKARANANLSPIPFTAALASKGPAAASPDAASSKATPAAAALSEADKLNLAEAEDIKRRRSQREVQQARYGTGG